MALLIVALGLSPVSAQDESSDGPAPDKTPLYRIVPAPLPEGDPAGDVSRADRITVYWNAPQRVAKLYVGTQFCGRMDQGGLARAMTLCRQGVGAMAEAEILIDAATNTPWDRLLQVVVAVRGLAPKKIAFVAAGDPNAASAGVLDGPASAGAPARALPPLLPAVGTRPAPRDTTHPLLLGLDPTGRTPLAVRGSRATPLSLARLRSVARAAANPATVAAGATPAPRPVVLFVPKHATWQQCRALLTECTQAGLRDLAFAVFDPSVAVAGGDSPADCWRRMAVAIGRHHGRQVLLLTPPAERPGLSGTAAVNAMADATLGGKAADLAAVRALWSKHGLVAGKAVDAVVARYVALVRAPQEPAPDVFRAVSRDMRTAGVALVAPVNAEALPALFADLQALTERFHPEMAETVPPAEEATLTGLKVDGDAATATAAGSPLRFVRVDGRWFVSMQK